MKLTHRHIILLICFIAAIQSFAKAPQLNFDDIDSTDYISKARFYHQQAESILGNKKNINMLSENAFNRYMTAIRSEANCYYMLDNYRMLGELASKYQESLNNRKNLDSEKIARLQMYGNKLWGSYYYGQTEYNASAYSIAEEYYLESLKVDKYNNTHTSIIYRELSQLYYKWGLTNKNILYFKFAFDYLNRLKFDAEIGSQQAMCLARMGQYAKDISSAIQYFSQALDNINNSIKSLKKNSDKYAEALRKKGKIIILQHERLGVGDINEAKDCYNNYLAYQKKHLQENILNISNQSGREQYWLALHQFLHDCVKLGNNASDMIYNLVLFSKGYLIELKHNKNAINHSWTDVKNKLKKEECAIEFISYDDVNNAQRMGALIIKKNSDKPKFIDIGNIDSIMSIKLYNGKTFRSAITSNTEASKKALFSDSTIFKSLWTPNLLNEIADATKVFFAPDGFIHQLAIEYMAPKSITCYRLSSTRVLLSPRKTKFHKILLCGDINFNSSITTEPALNRSNDINGYYTLAQRQLNINPLPGTRIELDSIYNIVKSYHAPIAIDTLTNIFATENTFCKIASKGIPIVHIATHGYFIGSNNFYSDLKPALNDNSMSESGLIMAGASANIKNPYFDPATPDGLLTAKELSDENLKYIDLMVLSACQSGMGYITNDGVYGIIKGLKEAGVGATIVSLWEVNDAATSEIMKRFYTELLNDPEHNIHSAFNKARQSMIENGGVDIRKFSPATLSNKTSTVYYNEPYFTNPFILIDAW